MRYTYDILLNLKKNAYEFFEWNKGDDVHHIKIIPTFKVSEQCFFDCFYGTIKVDKEFLNKIYKKTEVFINRSVKQVNYVCVIFCENNVLAAEFNNEGILIGKSCLLFDEADDILKDGSLEKITDIKYEIISKNETIKFLTRKEERLINILKKYLYGALTSGNDEQLKYLYFECFNKSEEDLKKAYSKMLFFVEKADKTVLDKLKNLFKVIKK